uniref:HAD family hydrolase n=1 Tax=Thermosphaera aggregans TaxID=54254 RepID=A0A7C2FFF8_9CREN
MGVKLVIFDYDLTFVDNYVDFYEAYSHALKIYGCKPPSFDKFMEMLEHDELEDSVPAGINKNDFWRLFRRVYVSRHGFLKKGCKEALNTLKSKYHVKTAIISGRETSSEYIWMELRRLGVDEFIDEVYTLQDLVYLNGVEESLFDKSWLLNYVMRKHGVLPCQTVFLGDYITDYLSALKSNVYFIGVNQSEVRGGLMVKKGVGLVARDFYDVLLHISSLNQVMC